MYIHYCWKKNLEFSFKQVHYESPLILSCRTNATKLHHGVGKQKFKAWSCTVSIVGYKILWKTNTESVLKSGSLNSSVNIVSRLWGTGAHLLTALGSSQPLYWTEGSFSAEVKLLGHEAGQPPPRNCKVKNMWSYTAPLLHGFILTFSKHWESHNISPLWQLTSYFMEISETVQKLLQNEQSYI
jgi:hypothetical protein